MITKIVPIGNSKGIRIPKHIMKLFHISNEIDMVFNESKSEIILRPVKKIRQNWEEQFKKMTINKDDKLLIDDSLDLSSNDWSW